MKLLTQWAFTSSILILIVLAARYLFRNRLSARLRYALWGVVLLRLLVPFQIELPAPVSAALPVLASNLAPEVGDVELYALRTGSRPMSEDGLAELRENGMEAGDVIGTEAPIFHIGEKEVEGGAHCFVLSDTGVDTYFFYTTLPRFLMVLWAIGAIWAALTIFRSNRHFFGKLKHYRHALEGPEAPVPVYTAANLPSPCLFGVFRPAVYVTPQAAEDPDTLRHVLAHELTHYAHKDHLWSLLRCLALTLHWYNPLVWLAVGLSKGDGELACDEGAVARLGEAERIPYGRTLVDMVAKRSLRPGDLLSCSTAMTGGKKSIQQRVAALVKKPETVRAALFAAAAVVALATVFVFAGRAQPQPGRPNSMLLSQLEQATGIGYSPPLYFSSPSYPEPITDSDLLARAKEALSGFTYLEDGDRLPDLTGEELFHCSYVSLINDNASTVYTLLWQNNFSYLLPGNLWEEHLRFVDENGPGAQLQGVSGTCISQRGDNVIAVLKELARLSARKEEPASPELEAFLADLDNASSIRYCPPSYSSYFYREAITDPDLLEQARELLSCLVPLEPGDAVPDGNAMIHASRIVLTTGGEEVTYSLIPWNDYTCVTRGSGDYFVQENGRTAFLRTGDQTDLSASIAALARMQEPLSQAPSSPALSIPADKSDTDDEKDDWDKQQTAEYQAVGVTVDGKNYYYQGQLVNIFLDIRANQSFYTLDTNPAGTVNVKIIRSTDDKITGAEYMTDAEAAELLADLRDGED